jgi:hypothetical protein
MQKLVFTSLLAIPFLVNAMYSAGQQKTAWLT